MTLGDEVDRMYAAVGYGRETWTARLLWVRFGPLALPLPSPRRLPWHDANHALSGYWPTDLVGEGEASAWELRTGTPTAYLAAICLVSALVAFVLAPRRVVAAWRRAAGTRNLYGVADPLRCYPRDLEEVRRELGLPAGGFRAAS